MASQWKVTGQRTSSQFDGGGQFIDGQMVTFQTSEGHRGQVFIPETQIANIDYVKATIQTKADALDAIGQASAVTSSS
jgi:hypothetical protein